MKRQKFTRTPLGLFFALSALTTWHVPAHAIAVTNETWCQVCNSYDPTLPAEPTADADYATELAGWMNAHSPIVGVTKAMAQSVLDLKAQPLGVTGIPLDNSDSSKGELYSSTGTIKNAMRALILLEYLQKSIKQWDSTLVAGGGYTSGHIKAGDIAAKYVEFTKNGVSSDRNPLWGAVIGFGGDTYGDLYRGEGILEGFVEGSALSILSKEQMLHPKKWIGTVFDSSIGEIRNSPGVFIGNSVAVGISTILKSSKDPSTHDMGYLLGTVATGVAGLMSGGLGLAFAPAQILTDTFDKISAGLTDETIRNHFFSRYTLITRYPEDELNRLILLPRKDFLFESSILFSTPSAEKYLEPIVKSMVVVHISYE